MPIRPERKHLYPKNWKEISARIRFGRAGGRCEFKDNRKRCKARHGKPHPITGSIVVLTVAHLNHDETDCHDDNLLAGCQLHHLNYDKHQHAKTRRSRKAVGDLFAIDDGWPQGFVVHSPIVSVRTK